MNVTTLAIAAALAVPIGAVPALAEGFSVRDLLETSGRDDCLRRGESILRGIVKTGGGEIDVTEWVIYGWDIGPGVNDLTLMCPVVAGGIVNGFVVVYGDGAEADRTALADRILAGF